MSKIMHNDIEYAGVPVPMTLAEAEAGTAEEEKTISPKVLHDYVEEGIDSLAKPRYTIQPVTTGTASSTLGFYYPTGATSGTIRKLAPLGQPTQTVSYQLTLSSSTPNLAFYFGSGESPISGFSNLADLCRQHATMAYIEWTY